MPRRVFRIKVIGFADSRRQFSSVGISLIELGLTASHLCWADKHAVHLRMRDSQPRAGFFVAPKRTHPKNAPLGTQTYPRQKRLFLDFRVIRSQRSEEHTSELQSLR